MGLPPGLACQCFMKCCAVLVHDPDEVFAKISTLNVDWEANEKDLRDLLPLVSPSSRDGCNRDDYRVYEARRRGENCNLNVCFLIKCNDIESGMISVIDCQRWFRESQLIISIECQAIVNISNDMKWMDNCLLSCFLTHQSYVLLCKKIFEEILNQSSIVWNTFSNFNIAHHDQRMRLSRSCKPFTLKFLI